ncbi:ABC-three component system middle component 2 [Oerskovia enterophila]|uniref:ABC-three component system middle component 2 n=1 Tax=Oerskovia enterophila TaxID=43678 RepID=UPI003816B961
MTPTVLNGPFELANRILYILDAAWPQGVTFNSLALLDYALVHSEELGGPPSLHPATPGKQGELAVRRPTLQTAIALLIRHGLIDATATDAGIAYSASESAGAFVELIQSDQGVRLRERSEWIAGNLVGLTRDQLREVLRGITSEWQHEFETPGTEETSG